LRYHAVIDLTTDNGTLVGSFESIATAGHPAPGTDLVTGLLFTVGAEAKTFTGSLGIRVDPSRAAKPGHLGGQIALGVTPWASILATLVDYTDDSAPLQDQDDGMFWPADFQGPQNQGVCALLNDPVQQRTPISIDAYNAL
jgi:hypothetical protein